MSVVTVELENLKSIRDELFSQRMSTFQRLASKLSLKKQPSNKNLNDSKSSGLAKSNTADSDVSEAILAFRTITTMLSLIQSPSKVTNAGRNEPSALQRYDLRVLDALSAIVVREHEIAAVMAKPYDGTDVQVFASVEAFEPALTIPHQYQPSDSKDSIVWNPLNWFMVTPNPRSPKKNKKDKIDSLTTWREVVKVVEPIPDIAESDKKGEDLLDTFLKKQWWVFW